MALNLTDLRPVNPTHFSVFLQNFIGDKKIWSHFEVAKSDDILEGGGGYNLVATHFFMGSSYSLFFQRVNDNIDILWGILEPFFSI